MTMTMYKVLYNKFFNFKSDAEDFIESHKKQDCFELRFQYHPMGWIVTKTKQI